MRTTFFKLMSALALTTAIALPARAFVAYSVTNPSQNFVFFTYDSPGFITQDTVVPGALLSFNNAIHPAVSVDFVISSPLDPGFADVQITINPFPGLPTVQDKFVQAVDLTQYGIYQAASGSFGFPNSFVQVEAPEPTSMAILGTSILGLVGLRRRQSRDPGARRVPRPNPTTDTDTRMRRQQRNDTAKTAT